MKTLRNILAPSAAENLPPFSKGVMLALLALLVVKVVLLGLLIDDGFIALSDDDFARQLSGNSWENEPFFMKPGWPPMQFWILGSILKIIPDIRTGNLIMNVGFSLAALWFLFLYYRRYFDEKVSLAALAIVALMPWHSLLALSGLSEPTYHLFLFAGLYLLARYDASRGVGFLAGASFVFLLGNIVRIDAWVAYIAVFIFLSLLIIFEDGSWRNKAGKLAIFLIPAVFIVFWIDQGNVLNNFQEFQAEYSRATSGLTGDLLRIIRYPVYFLLISPLLALFSLCGIARCLKRDVYPTSRYILIPLLYFTGLTAISVLTGSDTLSAPLRLVAPVTYLTAPFALLLFQDLSTKQLKTPAYIVLVLLTLWNVVFTFNYNDHDYVDANKVARKLKTMWMDGDLKKEDRVLFERNYLFPYKGDHVAIKVLSGHPDDVVIVEKNNSEGTLEQIKQNIDEGASALVIASSYRVKESMNESFPLYSKLGAYNLYRTIDTSDAPPDGGGLDAQLVGNGQAEAIKKAALHAARFEHGGFPTGITTLWKFPDGLKIPPLNIRFKYELLSSKGSAFFTKGRYLGDFTDAVRTDESGFVVDWQVQYLPKGAEPGKYRISAGLSTADPTDAERWFQVGSAYVMRSKREVMQMFLDRKTKDLELVGRVLVSFF